MKARAPTTTTTTSAHLQRADFDQDARLLMMALLAGVIGLAATGGAWVLLAMIRLFTNLFFYQSLSLVPGSPAAHALGGWVIAVPALGGLIVGLIARLGTDKIRGHGIPEAIEAILFGQSKMSPKVAVLKPLSSGIAIGSGGPFGAEGPIIMTGGAIGSLLAQFFALSAAERKALLVAGAAAGMTAVFGTPLAAVLLAVEVLLFELRPRSLVPVGVACAVAGFARALVLQPGYLFALTTGASSPWLALECVAAGLVSGVLAAALSKALYAIEDGFGRLPLHWMWWPALGGLVVGVGGWLEPRTMGVGYDVIDALLRRQMPGGVAFGLIALKALVWLVALGSLTSGGVLAPVLTIGAGLGLLLSGIAPMQDAPLWPLLCMAGVLGGVMHAPLMAAAFALGLTGDEAALLPLLGTTIVSYGCTVVLMRRSILTEKIARRGRHIWRETGVDPLERHAVEECMSRQVQSIAADTPVARALSEYFGVHQAHRAYPVLQDGRLVGMVDRAVLAAAPAGATCAAACAAASAAACADACTDARAGDSAGQPPAFALGRESCRAAATRMARLQLQRLPVVADDTSLRLLGLIARSDLVELALAHHHEEELREQPRRFAGLSRRKRA